MELGSIHPDEQSARRAVSTLIAAGIEPERVKLIRPRVPRVSEPVKVHGWKAVKAEARELSGGATMGGALGAIVCVILTVLDAAILAGQPLTVYAWIVGASVSAGVSVAWWIRARDRKRRKAAQPRVRRPARGWAVVVHARDADQRYLAARALARARGPVAA